jgi:hypothetical protein
MTGKNVAAVFGVPLAAVLVAACSYLVDADRSKVSNTDTLYQPSPMEEGGADASDGQAMGDAAEDGGGGDATTPDGSTDGAAGDGAAGDGAGGDAATTDGASSEAAAEGGPGDAGGG